MRELFWLSDEQLYELRVALLTHPARNEKLFKMVERERKARL